MWIGVEGMCVPPYLILMKKYIKIRKYPRLSVIMIEGDVNDLYNYFES